MSSNHCQVLEETELMSGARNGKKSVIVTSKMGTVSAAQTQNRLVMSRSSGFFSSAALTVRGSRAMPQIGHGPGSSRTICGCMGQVYSIFVAGSAARTGSSAIPHLGQSPGPCCRTSGSMGQVCSFAEGLRTAEPDGGAIFAGGCAAPSGTAGAMWIGLADIGEIPMSVFGIRYLAGSALNFSLQPEQQK